MPSSSTIGNAGAGEAARTVRNAADWMAEQQDLFVFAVANEVRQLVPEQIRQGRFSQVVLAELSD